MTTGERAARRPELDGLRGVAILLVLVGHAFDDHGWGSLAAAGVTLFFGLSGLLITQNLLAERARHGHVRLARFYWRRTTRLAPPLVLMLVVTSLVIRPEWNLVWPALTWTMNYALLVLHIDIWPFGHTWSLAVEEQFYLVWPLMLGWLLTRRRPASTLLVVVLTLGAWRLWLTAEGALSYAYSATETAGVALLVGCLIALTETRMSPSASTWGVALILGVSALAAASSMSAVLWMLVPLAVIPILPFALAGAPGSSWLTWRTLGWCGTASYSMYLWHQPVAYALDVPSPVGTFVGAACGAFAWWAFERPLMAWRARTAEVARRVRSSAPADATLVKPT